MSFVQVLEHYGIPARTGNARCPIHGDQHPSMSINLDREVWKCHVCDKGGGAAHLVAAMEEISLTEADQWIADRFGWPVFTPKRAPRPSRRKWVPPWRRR